MKTLRTLLLGWMLLTGLTLHARPKYWTWMHYSPRVDWEQYFSDMTEVGIRGLLLQSSRQDMEKVLPIAQKYGVEVQAWMWIMNNGGIAHEHPDWLDYNREGYSLRDKMAYVGYYRFLNPAVEGVKEAIAAQIEDMASVEGLSAISMDYCRYVDQILPTSLWKNYGIVQDREYAEWDYGYHPAMLKAFEDKYGYDPSELEDPTQDSLWFQFRLDGVTEVANMVGEIAHRHGKLITASPFPTPAMSRTMVRQDWARWNLDMAFPMIYHGFYYGDENWIADCVRECIADKPGTEIYCGLYIPDFGGDSPRPTLTQAMAAALEAGAAGISIFTFDMLSPQQREEMKTFIRNNP